MEDRWASPTAPVEDRLAALRPPRPADRAVQPTRSTGRKFAASREVVLGVILLLVGAVIAVVLLGGNPPVQVALEAPVDSVVSSGRPQALASGQAYFAAFVETGAYPPRLSTGDSVVVVVTPISSSDGTTRMLQDVVRVIDVRASEGAATGAVVTLLGPETTVRDIADSGSVHLAIVERGE